MKILLIVDVQNDFCPGGALAVHEGDKIVPLINRLMREGGFNRIIATKDWHPSGHSSFGNPWPVHCVQHTPGAEFHPDLEVGRIQHVILKGTNPAIDSYSGFFDNDGINATGLGDYILDEARIAGIDPQEVEICVCGLATDYCVAATARDAKKLGLRVNVIVDACRAVNLNAGDEERTLRELAQLGIELCESRELIALNMEEHPRDICRAPERGLSA